MRTNSNRIVSVVICGLLVFESVVLGATGQGSAGTSPTAASAQSAAAESGDGRARWLADHQAWRDYRLRNPTSVFSFEQLSSIFAEQRAIERFVEAFTITQELTAGWQDSLRRAAQETEIDHIHTDVVEIQEAYEELHAEYERLAEEANDRGAGLLGMIASLAVNMVVSAIPGAGPVLGSAVAAGFSKAINGGSFGEVLFAMGLAAGASFVAQEVSEAMLPDAESVANGSVPPPSQAMLNQASAGAAVAGFSVSQPGTEFMRELSQVPSPTFSPQLIAATADPRGRPMVVRRTSDLEQAVGNALRRLSAGASEAGPAPDAAPRPDVARRGPQASGARSLSDRVWAARQVQGGFQPALSGDSLLVIHALQREIEKLLFAYQVDRELNMRVRRGLERMVREAEAINLSVDREQAVEAYEDLLAAYEQLREDIRNRGGGLFGAICSLVGTVVGTLIGGPFLGAAFAGAIGTIANGGHVGEALVMAGFNTGVTYAYSVAVPALRNVLAGSPAVDGGQTSLDEMIDAELAEEIESFYIDPVLDGGGDDSSRPGEGAMRAAAVSEASTPVAAGGASSTPVEPPGVDEAPLTPIEQLLVEAGYDQSLTPAEQFLAETGLDRLAARGNMRRLRRLQSQHHPPKNWMLKDLPPRRNPRQSKRLPPPEEFGKALQEMKSHPGVNTGRLFSEAQKWMNKFKNDGPMIHQRGWEQWLKDDALPNLLPPAGLPLPDLRPGPDHGNHYGPHPGRCCAHDPDGDGNDDGPGLLRPRKDEGVPQPPPALPPLGGRRF